MSAFNRLLIVLLDLVLLVSCGAIVPVTLGWLPLGDFAGTPWFADRLAPFAHLGGGTNEIETLTICSGLLLLGLILLVLELVTLLPGERPLTLKQDGLGRVTVDRDVVCELASREASQVPGVMGLEPRVRQDRAGLEIQGRLAVEPTVNLTEVTEQVQNRIKARIEHSLGQPVDEVRLSAQLAPLSTGPGTRRHLR